MLLEEAMRAHLAANSGVAALVGARIRMGRLEQTDALPALTLYKISGVPDDYAHDGPAGMESRIQLSCLAEKYSDAKALTTKVKQAMRALGVAPGALGGSSLVVSAFLENEVDAYDPSEVDALSRFNIALDYLVQSQEDF